MRPFDLSTFDRRGGKKQKKKKKNEAVKNSTLSKIHRRENLFDRVWDIEKGKKKGKFQIIVL